MPVQPPSNARPKKKPASRVRGLAIDVLGEWAGGERYASDILDQAQRECDLIAPDAAFLREIVLTTLRNLSLLTPLLWMECTRLRPCPQFSLSQALLRRWLRRWAALLPLPPASTMEMASGVCDF